MIKEIFIIFDSLSTDVTQFDFPAEHMENVGKFTAKLYSQNSIFTSVGEKYQTSVTQDANEGPDGEDFLKKIADQAQVVLAATHTIEDAVD